MTTDTTEQGLESLIRGALDSIALPAADARR